MNESFRILKIQKDFPFLFSLGTETFPSELLKYVLQRFYMQDKRFLVFKHIPSYEEEKRAFISVSKNTAIRQSEVILLCLALVRLHLRNCIHSCTPPVQDRC